MVLDVCPPLPSPPEVLRRAVERTAAWAARAKEAHHRTDQALFGIVQGGVDAELRAESAKRTVDVGFDGYGIGGLSVGESRSEMLDALEATATELPEDRPRYLMGVGDPLAIVEAVTRGVDLFDCVLPTRLARHGTMLTSDGRLNLRNARFARDDRPIDEEGPELSRRWSRAYLRHLLKVDEPSGARLLTLHNVAWILDLVRRARDAVEAGTLDGLRREVAEVWEDESGGADGDR
jgi:queuine tRNA-ribosyltransferase